MSANPYESPTAAAAAEPPAAAPPLTLGIATQYVLLTSGGSALFGCLTGAAIAFFAPHYYRAVFNLPGESAERVFMLGVILGTTQGLVSGAVLGVVIVAIYAWYLSRRHRVLSELGRTNSP